MFSHSVPALKLIRAALLCVATVMVPLAARAATAEAAEPTAVASASSASRDYVVFLGLDIQTDVQGKSYPVVSGRTHDVEVQTEEGRKRVALLNGELKTAMEPKLSRAQVQIEAMKDDRYYSPANDPQRDAMAQQMVMETAQSHAQEMALIEANQARANAEGVARAASQPNSPVTQSDVNAAQNAAEQAETRLNSALVTPAFRSAMPGMATDNQAYDSFETTFQISSPEPRANVCAVLRLLVRDPENPERPAQTLKFFELRDLGPKPRRVRLTQMGLPPGFSVDSYSVHIYADGEELPTNLSSNRVDVTEDEAHQFLMLQHLQGNRQQSLPAQVVLELRSARLKSLVPDALLNATVDLAINQNGRVTKVHPSAGFTDVVTPQLEAALAEVRFLPALLNGNPVASRGTFALGELVP